LTGGQYVVAYLTPTGGVEFDELNGALDPLSIGTTATASGASWVDVQAQINGGFTVEWLTSTGLLAQDFNSAGAAIDQPYQAGGAFPLAPLAFSSNAQGSTLYLMQGGYVVATQFQPPNSAAYLEVQQYTAAGVPVGPTFATNDTSHFGTDTGAQITPLAGGGYVFGWVQNLGMGSFTYNLSLEPFAADGTALTSAPITLSVNDTPATAGTINYAISGLADGGFVAVWSTGGNGAGSLMYEEFTAAGAAVGLASSLGTIAAGATPTIDALSDGRYVVSWTGTSGAEHAILTASGHPLGAVEPAPTFSSADQLLPTGSSVTLSDSPGWTSALVTSGGNLIVANPTGQTAQQELYSLAASSYGQNIITLPLNEYASDGTALDPKLTALPGGFIEVTYAGTSDYQIENSAGQAVFTHNAWTAPTLSFVPLLGGDYIIENAGYPVFGLVQSDGTTSWISQPADIPAGQAPIFDALQGGGFAVTSAGSTTLDLYSSTGQSIGQAVLGASMSSFATAFAADRTGGFAEAWLSADGGQGGQATSLDIQTFDSAGHATSTAVTLTQDLDPWHTQIQLQAHADGSYAALWSQGGAIWGAEIANGAASAAHVVGIAGALSDVVAIQMPGDEVGFAFLSGGQAYAEIFNPATGQRVVADLGTASGDASTLHALATTDGALAVSWHQGSSVLASLLSASGAVSTPVSIGGDLIGVDASGHAVVLSDNGQGVPVLQAYTTLDGLFWHA
jgi:hypothetical protein